MPIADELAALYRRDLLRLAQQLPAFTHPDQLWQCVPGITNSAGNLMLHLEGNLREYVGRLLGGIPYRRQRDLEFSEKGIDAAVLTARIEDTGRLVPGVIGQLSDERMQAILTENPLGAPLSTQQFLIHLYGHLSYHLGQIDYLRRMLRPWTTRACEPLGIRATAEASFAMAGPDSSSSGEFRRRGAETLRTPIRVFSATLRLCAKIIAWLFSGAAMATYCDFVCFNARWWSR
jgi:hypothetical protein